MYNKMVYTLLFVPVAIFTMENQIGTMTVLRWMMEVPQFAGKFLLCKPRVTLAEGLWSEQNFAYIDPKMDSYRQKGEQDGRDFFYLHVLSHYKRPMLTRVISEKTLDREPLLVRLATPDEIDVIKMIMGNSEYNFEFSNRAEYNESHILTKRLCIQAIRKKNTTIQNGSAKP